MTKYKGTEEKPLSELLETRRSYYMARIANAFDAVYRSKDFDYIDQFEQAVLLLSNNAEKNDLEKIVSEFQKKTGEKTDKRPALTSYQYAKARDEGMTNEEIMRKYKVFSGQLGGFAKAYNRRKKAKIEQPSTE